MLDYLEKSKQGIFDFTSELTAVSEVSSCALQEVVSDSEALVKGFAACQEELDKSKDEKLKKKLTVFVKANQGGVESLKGSIEEFRKSFEKTQKYLADESKLNESELFRNVDAFVRQIKHWERLKKLAGEKKKKNGPMGAPNLMAELNKKLNK
jgi:hypothetical protein